MLNSSVDTTSAQMHGEILGTIIVFLSSANREIVKSALGYVKLAVHTLPVGLLRPYLKDLVPALLSWSHDHKNHFKAKVRHIFERMIRRFGWEDVYSHAEQEEARKVLLNIKKRKDRAKRKKNAREADGEEDEVHLLCLPSSSNVLSLIFRISHPSLLAAMHLRMCFTAVKVNWTIVTMISQQCRLASVEADMRMVHVCASTMTTPWTFFPARLRESPVRFRVLPCFWFYSYLAACLVGASDKKRRKPGQDASRFKTDDDSGRMIIDESGSENADGANEEDVAGVAYREAITSADGFTRGPNGKIKFNKDTKKRRHEAMEADDVEMGDAEESRGKDHKRKAAKSLGHEFKAKVRAIHKDNTIC